MNRSATAHDTSRTVISTRNNSSDVFALLQWWTATLSVATDRVGNDNAIAATIAKSDSIKKAHLRRRVIGVALATWNYARASTAVTRSRAHSDITRTTMERADAWHRPRVRKRRREVASNRLIRQLASSLMSERRFMMYRSVLEARVSRRRVTASASRRRIEANRAPSRLAVDGAASARLWKLSAKRDFQLSVSLQSTLACHPFSMDASASAR